MIGPCAHCHNPATARCAWPVDRFSLTTYANLIPGDRIRRASDRTGRPPATVQFIGPWFPDNVTTTPTMIQLSLHLHERYKEILAPMDKPVRVLRPEPCGAPVCDDHHRELSDSTAYCCDHWDAWSQVA